MQSTCKKEIWNLYRNWKEQSKFKEFQQSKQQNPYSKLVSMDNIILAITILIVQVQKMILVMPSQSIIKICWMILNIVNHTLKFCIILLHASQWLTNQGVGSMNSHILSFTRPPLPAELKVSRQRTIRLCTIKEIKVYEAVAIAYVKILISVVFL